MPNFEQKHISGLSNTQFRCQFLLLKEIISYANLALEDKKIICRARKPSYIEEHKSSPSNDASYLADSQWANIESVESVDPYPGQAKSLDPYPGEAKSVDPYPSEAENEGSNKESSPLSNYNENRPGRLCRTFITLPPPKETV